MNLSEDQQEAIRSGVPVRFTDPELQLECVVVRADIFDRVRAIINRTDSDPEQVYPLLAELSPEDWEDPSNYGLSPHKP